MATSNTAILTGASLFIDTANGSTVVAVKASSAVIYQLELDNTANAAASYFKMFNVASGSVTLGTTVPDKVEMVPASTKITITIPGGVTYGTACSCASTTAGGTAGTTAPSSGFIVKIVYV